MAEILQETGVSVEVPPADVAGDTITLRGPYEDLGDGNLDFRTSRNRGFHFAHPSKNSTSLITTLNVLHVHSDDVIFAYQRKWFTFDAFKSPRCHFFLT